MSAIVAAFVTLGVVLTLGLLMLCLFKSDDKMVGASLVKKSIKNTDNNTQKTPVLLKKATELDASKVAETVNAMKDGDVVSLMFYSPSCPWCKKFKSETLEVLEKKNELPFPVRMVKASAEMRKFVNEDKLFKKIATEVKGLPTSVILYKRSDGMYMAPMVGFTGAEEFKKKALQTKGSAKKID